MNCVIDKLYLNINICNLLCFGFVLLIHCAVNVSGIIYGKIIAPPTYTALTRDFPVEFQTSELLNLVTFNLKITYLGEHSTKNVGHIIFHTHSMSNSTKIPVPCTLFTRAGIYSLKIERNEIDSSELNDRNNHVLEHKLDVKWPNVKLTATHETIETYPSEPVSVVIEFQDVECPVDTTQFEEVPSFSLELIYCGTNAIVCDSNDVPPNQILYTQRIYGIQRSKVIPLNCVFFGLAGNYVLHIKANPSLSSYLSASAFIKADWNKQYILNIADTKSIFYCDSGIGIVVKYPACIMDNDRVRVYGKLRADVESIAPPTSLIYVSEMKITRGQHNVNFNCDLFHEKYIEYCFVYVTQAMTKAVADIRQDCVPTLPIDGPVSGKWGNWSDWSICSSKFSWGTRIRYRFCDSPTPRYTGKYCEGTSTETKPCGGPISSIWEYFFGARAFGPHNNTDVMDEVGPGCQCGCIIHLLKSKPRRMLASSSQTCPGRNNTLWLIQVEDGYTIQFNLDYFMLPCASQVIKVRDGNDAWMSELIGEYTGRGIDFTGHVLSSGNMLLIDFHLNDSRTLNTACYAGFIGHVELIEPPNSTLAEKSIMISSKENPILELNLIHFFVFIFCGIIVLISVFLGAQYCFRYHRYHLAKNKEEIESPLNTPRGSTSSIAPSSNPANSDLRAVSTSTLLSEIVTLVKIKPRSTTIKHTKLRESVVSQDFEKDQMNDCDSIGNYSNNTIGSTNTLTNDIKEELAPIVVKKKSCSAPESDTSGSICDGTPVPKKKLSLDGSELKRDLSTHTVKEFLKEKNQKTTEKDLDETSDCSSVGRVKMILQSSTLTSGNYSPAMSLASTARIRLNNQKESKDKRNRLKLLENPGSQYSISTQEELEMDYYDYNVINASAAPGSYLGMDPAFLVWIPPIDDGNIMNEMEAEDAEQLYHKHAYIDPGSNTETPDEESPKVPVKPPRKNLKSPSIEEAKLLTLPTNVIDPKDILAKINFLQKNNQKPSSTNELTDNMGRKTPFTRPNPKRSSIIEKETSVIKSPSDTKISEYYELSDIKFVDDDIEESNEVNSGSNNSYRDTNLETNG